MSKAGNIRIRKNGGAIVGTRRLINFTEGANITLTITDDSTGDEVDITIASAGGSGTAWLDQFFPADNPDSNYGTYNTVLMGDGLESTIRQTFMIPDDIATIVRAVVIIIPEASGNLRWSAATNFAQVCSNEDYQTHTDSIAGTTTAEDVDEVECVDISAALTNAVGGDLVGLEFTRSGENVADTINADVHYIGVLIQGST